MSRITFLRRSPIKTAPVGECLERMPSPIRLNSGGRRVPVRAVSLRLWQIRTQQLGLAPEPHRDVVASQLLVRMRCLGQLVGLRADDGLHVRVAENSALGFGGTHPGRGAGNVLAAPFAS